MNKTLIGIIALAVLATAAHAQFTEIGNPQHYGRINIPKAYGVIDANFAQIAGGTADVTLETAHIWVGDATSNQAAVAVSGDVTIAANGAVTIADEAVTYAKIQDVAGLSVVGRAGNTEGVSAAITGANGQVLRVSGTTLGFGEIAEAGIADGAVTAAKTHATVQTSLGKADTAVQPASINGATAIALTPADAGGTTGTVTVAITDIDGDPVDALVSWWISDTSSGAASDTNVDAVSITTGTAIIAESSTIVNSAVSTGGELVIEVDMTAAGTSYVSVAVGGLLAEATLITEE